MRSLVFVLVCLSLLATARAKHCPSPPTVQNFNITGFLGNWYEISASPLVKETFEHDCYCTRAKYGALSSPSAVSVYNICRKHSVNGELSTILGNATANPSDPAKLTVNFNGHGAPYWVLYLDDGNAIVWGCESIIGFPIEYLWILSRNPIMDANTLQTLKLKVQSITGYDAPKKFIDTVQQGCTYN